MRLSKTSAALMAVLFCACVVASSPVESDSAVSGEEPRDAKIFNFQFLPFVTINVRPSMCNAKNDNATGICSTKNDCSKDGGRADGTCANGYGVCCIYEKRCGGTVNKNVTYLVNTEYPDTLKDIGNCQYNIEKSSSNVCQLRLDFLTMDLQGPTNMSLCEADTFTFVGTAGANPTVICGENTGQHMYLDLPQGSGAARINIATTNRDFDRSWRIKVTQILCDSISRAPPSCLQYFTEYSGTINSFNYQTTDGAVHQLADQRYSVCIRTREGFCGIKYIADDFSMTNDTSVAGAALSGDGDCSSDFIIIPSMDKDGSVTTPDRYCGTAFVEQTTYSQPFEIRVVTDNTEDDADVDNKGFSIRYTQVPC